MSRLRQMRLVLLVVGLVACAAMAEPATQPTGPTPKSGPRPPRGPGWPDNPRGFLRQRFGREPIDEKQWEDAAAFLKEHSPNRLAFILGMSDERMKDTARRFVLWRYRHLQSLKDQNDTELYELAVTRMEMEDHAWGIAEKLRAASSEEQRAQYRKELTEDVKALVELGLQERQMRIARLEQALKREKENLETDRGRADALVSEQAERWEKQTEWPMMRHGPATRPGNEGEEGKK